MVPAVTWSCNGPLVEHTTWVKVSAVVAVGGPENTVAVGARP